MISVQNHRLQLNGNKGILPTVIALLFLSACSTTSKTSRGDRTIIQPNTPAVVTDNKAESEIKVDTIQWTEIDRARENGNSIEDWMLNKKDVYNISLMLPIEIDKSIDAQYSNPDSKLGRLLHYYAGTKLALEQLEDEGININIDVYDAESGNYNRKLQDSRNTDAIIGPRDRDQLATTANYGRNNNVPVISPWLSSSKLAKENPYYIQLIPSVRDHYDRLVEHVKANYDDDQVFLLGRKLNRDRATMRYIQNAAAALEPNGSDFPFEELYLDEDSLKTGVEAYQKVFFEDKTTVFILPNYSFSDDEDFVYNCVRKLSAEKGLNNVVLYGMPILLESDKVKFEHYNNLNMCIVRSSFVDKEDPVVKEFREMYFDAYNDFPSEEAYKGYDIMLFVGRSLYNYGTGFFEYLDRSKSDLIHTSFDVQAVYDPKDDAFKNIQYLQNKHLYVLSFEDFKFRKN